MGERRDLIQSICAPLPGAQWAAHDDGGLDAWKVGGKMFACLGTMDDGVSVKTSGVEAAAMLIDAGVGVKAKYFHRSWIRLEETAEQGDLTHLINQSYKIVLASLPKKVQAEISGG